MARRERGKQQMAKFVFELEAVLRQRTAVERAKQMAVAELDGKRLMLEDVIRDLQGSISHEKMGLREELGSGAVVNLAAVKMQIHASFRLTAKIQQYAIALSGVHEKLVRAREELRAASAARKAIENLKQARMEAWRRELDRKEAAELDEISIMSAARREVEVAI